MSLKRNIVALLLCGVWFVLVDAAFDREWPGYSAFGWAIYWGGFVVIAVVWTMVDRAVVARKAHSTERSGPTPSRAR